MDCEYCEIVRGKEGVLKIYEDDTVIAVLSEKGAVPGQVTVFTKEHYPIIEVVPDGVMATMFQQASVLTMSIFDAFQAQGTNALLHNGVPAGQLVPHVSIVLIPRKEKDGLDFSWKPKPVSPGDLEKTVSALKNEMNTITTPKPAPVQPPVSSAPLEKVDGGQNNYLLKQLQRIP